MSNSSRPARCEYTRAEILDHIRRLADGDEPPTHEEFRRDPAAPAGATARDRFGSWNAAVEAAGFEPRCYAVGERRWSDAEIIEHIRRLADGDDPPTCAEFEADPDAPSNRTAANHFGSWNGAVEAAGFMPRENPAGYSRDELLDWLIAHRAELGAWPTCSVLLEWPGPGPGPYRRVFGGFPKAVEAAAEVLDD